MDDQEEIRILRELENLPYHIKISKMSKGYNWEISVRGKDKETILKELQEIDERIRKTYGQL